MNPYKRTALAMAGSITLATMIAVPAQAAPMIVTLGQDLTSGPVSFGFMGGQFTFAAGPGFPAYLAVKTAGTAAVRTVFGNPSTDFTNRGTVTYDANTLGGYGAVPTLTSINYTNGDNFLGLRVSAAGQNYYGFAYTTDSMFNSFGFETTPDTAITPVTTGGGVAAVPEPATWALMIVGFGAIGGALRRRLHEGTLALRTA